MSLRAILFGVTAAIAGLAVASALALLLVSTAVHSVTLELGRVIESITIAEDAQTALLLHARVEDPLTKATYAVQLRRLLERAEQFVDSEDEAALLEEASSGVERYLSARGAAAEPALQEAFAALRGLTDLNVEEARAAERRSNRLDRIHNALAIGFSVFMIGLAALSALFLRQTAIGPLMRFSQAIDRYSLGDHSTRAPESGPSEIREAAQRFNEMADSLERQRERQVAFLGGVAHDLLNPLSALKTATALWAPGRPALSPEQSERTMGLVRRQIDRLERMVGDFVDTARIEAGQLELRLVDRDLRALARESVELFAAASELHELELTVPETPVVVGCDPHRVEQVLNNLISNAIKYSPSGGRVGVKVEQREGQGALAVSDEGIGIAADELGVLFKPFSRTGSSRESIPGVGLGLYVVRRIVEAHHGRIEVTSAPGAGSTFTVLLPRRPETATG